MRKFFMGLVASVLAQAAPAQNVIQFDVEFDSMLEASGAFLPFLYLAAPGDFNNNQPLPPSSLVGQVTLTVDPFTGELTNANGALNQIKLNGSYSTESGNSPSSGWSVHTFTDAVFDLYKPGSYIAINSTTDPDKWPAFTATNVNGALADHGPASIYGGTCPFTGGCKSSASAGGPTGTQPFILFQEFTNIFNLATSSPVYPSVWRNSGTHAKLSGPGSVLQTNPSTGLGFENGMDAFVFQGVLDATNALGGGTYQPYPDGVNGQPGIVRIMTMSSTGNTAYVFQAKVVPTVPAPLPAAAWLAVAAAGFTVPWIRRRRARD